MDEIRRCWSATGRVTAESSWDAVGNVGVGPSWDAVGDTSVGPSWSVVGGVPTGPSRGDIGGTLEEFPCSRGEIGDVLPGSSCSSTRIAGAIRRPKRARISIRELVKSVVTFEELGIIRLLLFTYRGSLLIHFFLAEVSRRGVVRGGPRVNTGPLSCHNITVKR